ncbi:MAG TPA: hypothetical protein VGM51_08790 [Armatimonadota bacterium]
MTAMLVVLSTWLSVGWECTGASAAAPVVGAASGMSCHMTAASVADGSACAMPCCQQQTRSSGPQGLGSQRHSSPLTCMAPKTSQTDIIVADVHPPVVCLVICVVPSLLLPAIDAAVASLAPPSTIPLPPRDPLSRILSSRAPPSLA